MSEPRPEVLVLIAEPEGRHVPIVVEVMNIDGTGTMWTIRARGIAGRDVLCSPMATRAAALCAAMGFPA